MQLMIAALGLLGIAAAIKSIRWMRQGPSRRAARADNGSVSAEWLRENHYGPTAPERGN